MGLHTSSSWDRGTRGQKTSRGTVLLMHERFPCIAVQQIIFDTTLQTVLSEQLPLLLLVLFFKIAGAEMSPAS